MAKPQAKTKTENTSAGEQHVIPGAEKILGAEVAKRKAREPLKPKVAQKPADEGLFGDRDYQTDLVALTRRQTVTEPREVGRVRGLPKKRAPWRRGPVRGDRLLLVLRRK